MEEYLEALDEYLKNKLDKQNKQINDLEFIESKDSYKMFQNNELILEIERPSYIYINNELKLLRELQKVLLVELKKGPNLTKGDFSNIQNTYQKNNESILQLEEEYKKINDTDSILEKINRLEKRKDELDEQLRQIYINLKNYDKDSIEWKELSQIYLGNDSQLKIEYNTIKKELEEYKKKELYYHYPKPNNTNFKINYYTDSTIHPTIYINELNNINTIDYIIEKPPKVFRKGILNKVIKEEPKKIKIKVKKKPKVDKEVIEKDCRKNPQRCIDLSIEKGKELICNETSGRCVNKPKNIDKPKDIDDKPKDIDDKPKNIDDIPKNIDDKPKDIDDKQLEKDCRKNPQRCIDLSIEKGKELICNEISGRCVNKPKNIDDKPKDIGDKSKNIDGISNKDDKQIEKDCRKNPQRCVDLSLEKGKELICNETSGRCVNKPKKLSVVGDIVDNYEKHKETILELVHSSETYDDLVLKLKTINLNLNNDNQLKEYIFKELEIDQILKTIIMNTINTQNQPTYNIIKNNIIDELKIDIDSVLKKKIKLLAQLYMNFNNK